MNARWANVALIALTCSSHLRAQTREISPVEGTIWVYRMLADTTIYFVDSVIHVTPARTIISRNYYTTSTQAKRIPSEYCSGISMHPFPVEYVKHSDLRVPYDFPAHLTAQSTWESEADDYTYSYSVSSNLDTRITTRAGTFRVRTLNATLNLEPRSYRVWELSLEPTLGIIRIVRIRSDDNQCDLEYEGTRRPGAATSRRLLKPHVRLRGSMGAGYVALFPKDHYSSDEIPRYDGLKVYWDLLRGHLGLRTALGVLRPNDAVQSFLTNDDDLALIHYDALLFVRAPFPLGRLQFGGGVTAFQDNLRSQGGELSATKGAPTAFVEFDSSPLWGLRIAVRGDITSAVRSRSSDFVVLERNTVPGLGVSLSFDF